MCSATSAWPPSWYAVSLHARETRPIIFRISQCPYAQGGPSVCSATSAWPPTWYAVGLHAKRHAHFHSDFSHDAPYAQGGRPPCAVPPAHGCPHGMLSACTSKIHAWSRCAHSLTSINYSNSHNVCDVVLSVCISTYRGRHSGICSEGHYRGLAKMITLCI